MSTHFARWIGAGRLCDAASLASPAAQRETGRLLRVLGAPHRLLTFIAPSPPRTPEGDAVADCHALLTFLQLWLGLVVPALVQAAAEGALFRHHRRQRRALGLRPEAGAHARLHAVLSELAAGQGWVVLGLGTVALYSCTWTVAHVLAAMWRE